MDVINRLTALGTIIDDHTKSILLWVIVGETLCNEEGSRYFSNSLHRVGSSSLSRKEQFLF
jgi:hypothetical protein